MKTMAARVVIGAAAAALLIAVSGKLLIPDRAIPPGVLAPDEPTQAALTIEPLRILR